MDVTVAIGTFGDIEWAHLAIERAIPSVTAQGIRTVHVHGPSLHEARNMALAQVNTEWVVFLDADDELEPTYLIAMSRATADVRAPAVRYVRGDGLMIPAEIPRVHGHFHQCTGDCLPLGNWLVIGAAVRASLVRQVGGFREWARFEDWDLWARCYLTGATFEPVPEAVYRAHVRFDSRNRANREKGIETHRLIAADLGLPVPP